MEKNSLLPHLQTPPWKANANSIWMATNLKIYRNVNKYLFPAKLDAERLKQLSQILEKTVLASPLLDQPLYFLGKELSAADKHLLFEHFLSFESFHEAHSSEGFIIDKRGNFLAIINIKDHLQLQIIDCKSEIEQAWSALVKIETEIGKKIDYAFSSKFGFLSSSPRHCGTGLVGHAYLHIPCLIHLNHLSLFFENELNEIIEATGLQGDLNELIGDLVVLYNRISLGTSEEEVIKLLRTSATKLMLAEKSARDGLKDHDEAIMKNKVSRAYGLLVHSYQIETVEALNAISLCKLGIDLNWLQGVDHTALNELFFSVRTGHLMSLYPENSGMEELSKKRAKLIHNAFKNTTLLI